MITEYDPLELMAQVTAHHLIQFRRQTESDSLGSSRGILEHSYNTYIVLLVTNKENETIVKLGSP